MTGRDGQQPYEILPPSTASLWRYMSLPKLLALLVSRSVFLCRADLLGDEFEGSFTQGSLQAHERVWGGPFLPEHVHLAQWLPYRTFVSCWHASEVESAALWEIYAGTEGAIAVRSTIGALVEAFPETAERSGDLIINQNVRSVQYIDYRSIHPHINALGGPFCYKRQAFAFEQEVRVIRQEIPTGPASDRPGGRVIHVGGIPDEAGRMIEVVLPNLIKAIYLAPSSPPWLLPTVQETLSAFDLENIECRQSSLDELPEIGRLDT
jgi:hypothetical protein